MGLITSDSEEGISLPEGSNSPLRRYFIIFTCYIILFLSFIVYLHSTTVHQLGRQFMDQEQLGSLIDQVKECPECPRPTVHMVKATVVQ